MGFDPAQHPREATGQFAEKTGAAPEVALGHTSIVQALAKHKMMTPIALGRLFDGLDEGFVEEIADYHVGIGQPGTEGYSSSDCDTLHAALETYPQHSADVFSRRLVDSLEGRQIAVYVGRENTTGRVTAVDELSVQLDDEDVWYDLGDAENVRFERRSYDIADMESANARAARRIPA